ncbi:MAG: CHAT domain-containing protein [Saprospiraceae bacterium]
MLFFAFCFFGVPVVGQDADSLSAVREVDSLINFSRNAFNNQQFHEAFNSIEYAAQIAKAGFGVQSTQYASCIYNRARALQYLSKPVEAESDFKQAIAIREKVLGKEHLEYARSLYSLARFYRLLQRYKEAELLYRETCVILEKTNQTNPLYKITVNELGVNYSEMGHYDQTEYYFRECIKIEEKISGKESAPYARALGNLGELYRLVGRYEKSERLQLESLATLEKILGVENISCGIVLYGLGVLNLRMCRYDIAETYILKARAIFEKTEDKEHIEGRYVACQGSLASIYTHTGQYEKAKRTLLEVLALLEKSAGKETPDYAGALGSLAWVYYMMDKPEEAVPRIKEAIIILEKTLGKEHQRYAISLGGLAEMYGYMGRYQEAESLFLEALPVFEKVYGKEPTPYVNSLLNLAHLYTITGQTDKALDIFLKILPILKKNIGEETNDYTRALNKLAILYETIGQYELSETTYREANQLQMKYLTKAAYYLSEQELSDFTAMVLELFDRYLSFSQSSPRRSPVLAQDLYENMLFQKGFLLQAVSRRNHLTTSDSTTIEIDEIQKSCYRLLAEHYVLPLAERDQALVFALENKADSLEKVILRHVDGLADAIQQVRWQEVQSVLKSGDVAIEFVRYLDYSIDGNCKPKYIALLLRPGDTYPLIIPLFEEKSLDSLLDRNTDRNELYVKRLYSLADRGARPLGKPQKTLYDLLWKPLEKELAGTNTIYYSPSGLLHRLNLAAIPIGLDSVLGDRYHLVELGSTRQLVVPATVNPAANDAVLFGGIAYDSDSTALSQANAAFDSISIASRGELSFSYTDSTLRTGTWSALPFTEREVGSVEKTLKAAGFLTDTRRGYAATEEAFKSIGNSHGVTSSHPVTGSPRVLHIATHGFFFPDPKSAVSRERVSGEQESAFKLSDHPMIRSGLLLAGANHAWATGMPLREGMEDGILTAYEISQMNLSNTELVVLSACETGLGDIQGNEGVYGLQRAFKIAGAKYLIMSLWQVPDKQTSLQMTTFYKKWLEEKMPIPDAFRAAQRELREAGLDPYYWAGFVLVE